MHPIAEFAVNYGLFLAKVVTLVAAVGLIAAWIAGLAVQARRHKQDTLKILHVNDRLEQMSDTLNAELLNDVEHKSLKKRKKEEAKQRRKAEKLGKRHSIARLFVLDFNGDIRASAVDGLRESITALLQVAESDDEVMVRLESGGGMVHSYGLAASQLARLRDAGVRLTIAVDRIAASGGYMMACVGDRIVAAPFAIIGSIGVIAQIPNLHRLLKDNNVDFEMHTAREYKRTLTVLGENTDAGREKFRADLEAIHGLFKSFIVQYRPNLDIDAVATGEHWHATQAKTLNLVDEITTSDDVMLAAARAERDVYLVYTKRREGMIARLTGRAARAARQALSENGFAQAVHRG